ncbi:MAG: hypothetical protein AAFR35_12280 [Pseudomonadota bacterium]
MTDAMVPGDVTVGPGDPIPAMVGGTLTIAGGTRTVSAMVGGDLILLEGADVIVSGMVGGHIIEMDGRARITGLAKKG